MKTHARRGEAGFSFVELLVTIIIAGIAFAAMVPLFVQAQKQTSADNMRNVTMQVAQDKLEKIRQLDYDQITQANLDDEDFTSGQFGNTYVYRGGGGATRDLTVTYVVALVPATLEDGTTTPEGREKYKQVQVEVSWTGPPDPVRAASLTTTIYRQFAGAAIRAFDVGPSSIFSTASGKTVITGGPVVLDAYIAAEDIDGMNADLGDPTIPEIRRRMGYVEFTISSANGFGPVRNKVYLPVTGEPGHYRYTWNNATVTDDIYLLEAVAVSGTQQKGPRVSVAFQVSRSAPPRPTGVSFIPGDGVVYLSWDPSPVGDLHHYEVYRSLDNVTFARIGGDLPAPSHTDTGLTNDTTYYYYVVAVDIEGNSSPPSVTIPAVPRLVSDGDPPSTPTNLSVSPVPNTPTVALQWDPSVDAGSGVKGYTVERSADQVAWWEVQGNYAPTDYIDAAAGWGATWYYRVQAIDNSGNASAWASVGPVTTPTLPMRRLIVVNSQALNLKAWVQNATTGYYYTKTGTASLTKPSGVPIGKYGGSVTWTNLPAGIYNVSNDAGYPGQAFDLTYGDGSVTI